MSSSTASASVSSSSSISFAEVTRQVQAVQQDHSLDYHQQEEHIRRIIELDNMHHGDLAHFLLAHASAADTTAEVFGSCLQTLEAYSRLYPDVLLSAHLAPLAQQPLMKHTDVSKHFLQLVKIGMKLVPKEQYTTETSSSLARYCLHVLTQADLVRAESANTLLETLVPLNYGTNLTWIHEYCQEFRTNATILLRLFSLVMKVSQGSDDVLNLCGQIGIVGDISRLCRDTDDLLLQINLMELFVELSNSVAGLEYLCSDGVVAWLISVGCGSADRAADPILESEALRVLTSIFAHASLHSFQFVEKIGAESVKNFLDAVHRQLDEGDEQSRLSGKHLLYFS